MLDDMFDWIGDTASSMFGGGASGLPALDGYTPGGLEDASLPMPVSPGTIVDANGVAFDPSTGDTAASATAGGSGGKSWFDSLGGTRGLATLGMPLAGAAIGAFGNNSAANTVSTGAVRAAQLANDGQAAARAAYQQNALLGVDAINTGVGNYERTINPLLTPNPIMLPQYRGLTTSQQIGLSDLDRQSKAALADSGLRGAGRGGIGTLMDSESRYIANAQDANDRQRLQAMQEAQRTANSARTGLAGVYSNQGTAIANTYTGIGNNQSQSLATTGVNNATAVNTGAQAQAGATIGNAQLGGGALGSLTATLSKANKADNADTYGSTSV